MQNAVFIEGAKLAAKAVPVIVLALAEAPFVAGLATGIVLTASLAYGTLWLVTRFR
jgi:hypothetical protein